MIQAILLAVLFFCVGLFTDVCGQTANVSARTQDLVSHLDKTKYKKKDKGMFHIEMYVDVKNTPDVKPAAEYSGHYETPLPGNGYSFDLQVASDGTVTGSGCDIYGERGIPRKFTLRDGKVAGALLTATQVFENGDTEPLEAVFVTQVTRLGKTEADAKVAQTMTGLGYLHNISFSTTNVNVNTISRVFVQKMK